MSKQDFELIAHTIKDLRPLLSEVDADLVTHRFAEALRGTNDRFNAERFCQACGRQEGA